MADNFPDTIPYKILKTRNDAYRGHFWRVCRALYSGGPSLLGDDEILREIMPIHNRETQEVYRERLKRAFYIPYSGSIIAKLVAELTAKPITFELEATTASVTDGGQVGSTETDDDSLPEYYADLVKNCGQPGGSRQTINELARKQILNALICGVAWTLVELPRAPAGGYPNRERQEAAGALNAYLCALDPESVVDWEEREDGELSWALIQDEICRREGIASARNVTTYRWRYYLEDSWAIYELKCDKLKQPLGPRDTEQAVLVDSGKHSFGRVPVRKFCLPEDLWVMGKLEAISRAHMNQRCALSWGQLRSLFPVPVLYAGPTSTDNPVSENENRFYQQHEQGFLKVLAEKDRLEYFSPDISPYSVAMQDLSNLRDEMYRVMHAMAQSVDNSGAALQRSAASKSVDAAAGAVILRALGLLLREHLEDTLLTISTGRKDNLAFSAHGADSFEDVTLDQIMTDAVNLSKAGGINSPTFNRLWAFKIAKLALGADTTEDDLEDIAEELKDAALMQETDAENLEDLDGKDTDLEWEDTADGSEADSEDTSEE